MHSHSFRAYCYSRNLKQRYDSSYATRCQALLKEALPDLYPLGDESVQLARYVWQEINGRNLHENILPTRERAQLILYKGRDHAVQEIWLRKL